MRILTHIIIILTISSKIIGQVCCSLVGSIDVGSASTISAHYPNKLDIDRKSRWIIGLSNNKKFDVDLNINYPFSTIGYVEFSKYFTNDLIGFINGNLSFMSLKERLSYDESSTFIIRVNGQIGLRKQFKYDRGLIEGSLVFPSQPQYSNKSFPFKNASVPSYSASWIKQRLFNLPINTHVKFEKNMAENPNVFIDNNYNSRISINSNLFHLILSPYLLANYQKLIAPITPYENRRDARWLGVISSGINIIPINSKYNWIHLNVNVPIYSWVTKIGFPDGTQPTSSISVSFFKSGLFSKTAITQKPNNPIFN